jgi:hypothetical protein
MVTLELLLAVLLMAALAFGFRLERRLRALRDGQAGFVKALSELDGAAQRTENGLSSIREATEEAGNGLIPVIEAARAAASRLEQLTGEAEMAAKRAEAAAAAVTASTRTLAGVADARRARPAPVDAAEPPPRRAEPPKLQAPDFAAMLAPATTTRQPLPTIPEPQPRAGGSRLREAAALLRGG